MRLTYDTDAILFKLLNGSSELTSVISGGIYVGERPMNSVKEDIIVNTITLSQDSEPQIGTSNVNIHVPDKTIKISETSQTVENRERLALIARKVIDILRSANVEGLMIEIESQYTLPEDEIKQHYVNIRITWNIN